MTSSTNYDRASTRAFDDLYARYDPALPDSSAYDAGHAAGSLEIDAARTEAAGYRDLHARQARNIAHYQADVDRLTRACNDHERHATTNAEIGVQLVAERDALRLDADDYRARANLNEQLLADVEADVDRLTRACNDHERHALVADIHHYRDHANRTTTILNQLADHLKHQPTR